MRLRVNSGLPDRQKKGIEKFAMHHPDFERQKRSLMQKLLSGEWHIRHSCESRNPEVVCDE